ncbi:hypothetical protein Tco_0832255 [Tanacetum coccineum]
MSDSEDSTVTYTEVSSSFEDLSNIGSPKVVVYGYDGLPMHLPSPDYVPGPEHPPSPDYVPYVPEPVYPEFMPPKDDFDPEEDLEEEEDEDPEEDPTDYTTNKDDKEEEEESSRDDADDEEEDEGQDKEEENLAPADSIPLPTYHTTARMFIRAKTPTPFMSEVEIDRLLAIPTPPPSPLTSYSSPLPQIPSPLLPVSS